MRCGPSRSQIYRYGKLDKQQVILEDGDKELSDVVHDLDAFWLSVSNIGEALKDDFFNIMNDYHLEPHNYIRQLGKIDPELPGKNAEQFDEMLWYLWERVHDEIDDFETILEILSSAFPVYELRTLKSAYKSFIEGQMAPSYEFVILLEAMADFDEIDGLNHFTSDVDKLLSADEELINLSDANEILAIFSILQPWSPIADIVNILESRFGIDAGFLGRLTYDLIKGFYQHRNLTQLLCTGALQQLFKFSDGFKLFGLMSENMITCCNNVSINDALGKELGIMMKTYPYLEHEEEEEKND